jgi:hypothetical protein
MWLHFMKKYITRPNPEWICAQYEPIYLIKDRQDGKLEVVHVPDLPRYRTYADAVNKTNPISSYIVIEQLNSGD